MSDSLRPAIRSYLGDLMRGDADIVVAEAADSFIAEHSDDIASHVAGMVRAQVSRELKALCAERAEDTGQLTLLPGIPAGIVIAPGVVKPRGRCTWDDLMVGRQERVQNIAHAEKALALYDEDCDALRPHMESEPDVTVAQVKHLLSG